MPESPGAQTDLRARRPRAAPVPTAGPPKSNHLLNMVISRVGAGVRVIVDNMGRVTQRRRVVRVDGAVAVERHDMLAAEEPLEIRLRGQPVAVTMRTPGDDFDLVAGFAWTEGLINDPAHLAGLRYCGGADRAAGADGNTSSGNSYNVVDLVLSAEAPEPDVSLASRNFYTTSSCGVCGKASIDGVRIRSPFDLRADAATVTPAALAAMPAALRAAQKVFDATGGLHGAGLFTTDAALLAMREDVGRHNAVDKVVGWALREGRLPLTGSALLISGRASFELVQKAYLAGIPLLAAVSAPSSLAVEFAEEVGMTLVGFLRGASMNIYTGADRIDTTVGTRLANAPV